MLEEMHNNRLCMDVFSPYIAVVFSYLFTFVVQFFFSVSMRNYGATLFAFEGIIFSCISRI